MTVVTVPRAGEAPGTEEDDDLDPCSQKHPVCRFLFILEPLSHEGRKNMRLNEPLVYKVSL